MHQNTFNSNFTGKNMKSMKTLKFQKHACIISKCHMMTYHTGQCLRRIASGNVGLPLDTT